MQRCVPQTKIPNVLPANLYYLIVAAVAQLRICFTAPLHASLAIAGDVATPFHPAKRPYNIFFSGSELSSLLLV